MLVYDPVFDRLVDDGAMANPGAGTLASVQQVVSQPIAEANAPQWVAPAPAPSPVNWATPQIDLTDANSAIRGYTVNTPPPGTTFRGLMKQMFSGGNPQQAVAELAQMWNSGYLNQLPDFTPEVQAQFGPWLASRQSEIADATDFMGINGLSIHDVSALSMLAAAAPGIAGALSASAAPTAAATEVASTSVPAGVSGVGSGVTSGLSDLAALTTAAPAAAEPVASGLGGLTQLAQAGNVMTDVPLTGGSLMPPAVPPADPTFGGVLTQTAPGAFENLGNISAFGSTIPISQFPTGFTPADIASGAASGLELGPTVSPSEIAMESVVTPPNPSEIGFETAAGTAAAGGTAAAASGGGSSGSGGGPASAAAGGTALSRLLDGSATAADILSLTGNLAGAGLGFAASDRASDRLDALARDYMALGAPSRARYEASFDPNFNVMSLPGLQPSIDASTDALLRRLSTQGNPYGNPGGLMEAQKYIVGNVALPQLNEYRRLNAGAGGLAALTSAAPGAATGSIGAEAGKFDAVGGAIADITNPRRSLADVMREMRSLV